MSKVNEKFKGVWVPKEIWCNSSLSWMEKLFLTEIASLDQKDGCFASNEYFSKFFKLSKSRCTQIITSLKKKKFISVKYKRSGKQITKRVLRILSTSFENCSMGIENSNEGIENVAGGYLENAVDNNTVNKTTNNTVREKELLSFFNKVSNKNFKPDNQHSIDLLTALLRDYSANDIQRVIKMKNDEWIGTKMAIQIKPHTIFKPENFKRYHQDLAYEKSTPKHKVNHRDKNILKDQLSSKDVKMRTIKMPLIKEKI